MSFRCLALAALLLACDPPDDVLPDGAPLPDGALAEHDGATDDPDGGLRTDASVEALDGSAPDGSSADGGGADGGGGLPGDFVRPEGSSQVCVGIGCYVEPPSGDFDFNAVLPVAPDTYWIASARGLAFFEDGEFTYLDPIAPHPLFAIDGTPRNVWAVGASGTTLHFDGERWTRVPTGVSSDLRDVWVAPDGRAYAVGLGGAALEYSDGAWRPIALGLTGSPNLYEVTGFGDEVWIAGADSTVLHLVDGTVTALDRESLRCDRRSGYETHNYIAIYAAGPGDVFISGTSVGSSPRGALVRVIGGVITCSERPSFGELDGTGPNDVWGASGERVAHWDGFDWTMSEVLPVQGAVTSIGPGRAVAIIGKYYAHLAELSSDLTATPIGHDFRRETESFTLLDVSPSGVAYFFDSERNTLTRRGTDGTWVDLHHDSWIEPRVLDDERAYWFDSNNVVGLADASGTTATYEISEDIDDIVPRTSTRVIVGTFRGVLDLVGGAPTPFSDTRQIRRLLPAGSELFGLNGSNVYRWSGTSWERHTVDDCLETLTSIAGSQVRGESWIWTRAGCVLHFRPDGSVDTRAVPGTNSPYRQLERVVGVPGTDMLFSLREGELYRLGADGIWEPLEMGSRGITLLAVDAEHLWYGGGQSILRARFEDLD